MSLFDPDRASWLRDALAPVTPTHVVDVGANPIEPVPYAELLANGGTRLTGFEPQAQAYAKLQKIKGSNETYHQFAVGDGRVRRLYLTRHDSMTSFFRGDMEGCRYLGRFGPALEVTEEVDLQTVALDNAAEVGDFHLLKIDIQGGETAVFRGATKRLSRAIAVIPEVRFYQLYHDEPMHAGVDADLRARGYALHKFMFSKALTLPTSQMKRLSAKRNANQLIDGDAVYIRDLAQPERYSDEDLKHLAILSDGVWFSFDLVVRCLDMLAARGAVAGAAASDYVDRLPDSHKAQPLKRGAE